MKHRRGDRRKSHNSERRKHRSRVDEAVERVGGVDRAKSARDARRRQHAGDIGAIGAGDGVERRRRLLAPQGIRGADKRSRNDEAEKNSHPQGRNNPVRLNSAPTAPRRVPEPRHRPKRSTVCRVLPCKAGSRACRRRQGRSRRRRLFRRRRRWRDRRFSGRLGTIGGAAASANSGGATGSAAAPAVEPASLSAGAIGPEAGPLTFACSPKSVRGAVPADAPVRSAWSRAT